MVDIHDRLVQEIAFSYARGVYGATSMELLDRIGGLENFFALSQAELCNLANIRNGVFADDYRKELLEKAQKEAAKIREKHISTAFIGSDSYPRRLANCEDAPVMLYQYGACDLSKAHAVAVVGTRHATPYGVEVATRLVTELAAKVDDLVIVSGLAYGIDVTAHKAALNAGVPTVAVMAHGLSRIYPAQHRDVAARIAQRSGAIVTEYTYDTTPQRGYFLARNRIIAGLSDCVVVVESDLVGGAMSTAHVAQSYNREVFAVPGRIHDKYSRGTNKLIARQTATILQSADELIERMGWQARQAPADDAPTLFRALSADEQQFVDYIVQHPEATVNEICVGLGRPYSAITDLAFKLEMDDVIITLPGGRYSVC